MKRRAIYCALALLGLGVVMATPAAANPFMAGQPSEANVAAMGFFATPFMQEIMLAQKQIHEAITDQIQLLKDGQSLAPLWLLLLISLAYGVFHVLAPGHGKVIVGSYFIGNKARWRDGMLAGLVMAVGHTVSAVAIVVVLYLVIGLGQFGVLANARYVELVSYGMIACIGVWLLVRALKGGQGCSVCGHDHAHDHHDHDHHDHGHALKNKQAFGLFAAASAVPCTGSMIILLFTLAGGVLWAGILAVMAIALGMWITITAIGMLSILLHRAIAGEGEPSPMRRGLTRMITIIAALVVMATGGLLCAGTFYSIGA
ncbi:MAG: hypothetical protein GC131_07660 [Alphaproteobacteria bacterium]|nr:hypothetical protein [Alphaproteobacteria bacterium]